MDYDIIIIGGGLAGLALAVALRGAQRKVALVEGAPPADFDATKMNAWDARIYAITPANARFLADIGVWGHLPQKRLQRVKRMEVTGDQHGRLDFSAWDSGVELLAWIAEAQAMRHELWQSAQRQANLTLFCPMQPTALTLKEQTALLTLSNKGSVKALKGSLVVAADGANSWTRQQAGIEVNFKAYGQHGVVANFACRKPHQDTAWQWFRDDGVLAWLPLPGNRISMVWSTPADHAATLCALEPAELAARVAAAGHHALGEMELITPAQGFPLRLMRAPSMVAQRLALIGDAAHTIHPLSGHGINLGFQDARVLAQTLIDCPAHVDCGDLPMLRRFERARREEVVLLQSVTDALQGLFCRTNQLPRALAVPLAFMRNRGLDIVQNLPFVRTALTRYAMG